MRVRFRGLLEEVKLGEFLGLLEEQLLLLRRRGVDGEKLVLPRGGRCLQEQLRARGLRMNGEELVLPRRVGLLQQELALGIRGLLQ